MKTNISDNLVRVIILDISGVYAQIHNQGYFDKTSIDEIKQQYSDTRRLLWSSVFVTLMAKKYRFMQFELDMVFDTH